MGSMRQGDRFSSAAVLLALAVVGSIYYLGAFLWIALNRAAHPFPLEWLESVQFLHALRIRQGLQWYPPPNLDFFSDIYPPGLPALGALAMSLAGERLAALRAVSIVATLASAAAMVRMVFLYTGRLAHGVVAAGLFLATFQVCGAWFDVARVDMLALACTLWGLALVHRRSGRASFAAGVTLLVAASQVKQNCVAFLAGALLVWMVWAWRRGLAGAALGAVLLGGALAALQTSSDGWFGIYTFTLPSYTPILWPRAAGFLVEDLPSSSGLLIPLVLAAGVSVLVRRRWEVLPVLLLPLGILASALPRANPGGYVNNLIFAAAFCAVAAGVALGPPVRAGRWAGARTLLAYGLVIAQLVLLRYDPNMHLPLAGDAAAGQAVVEKVRQIPGPVLAPYHPYLLHLAGKKPHMHFHLINELNQSLALNPGEEVRNASKQVLEQRVLRPMLDQILLTSWTAAISSEVKTSGHEPAEERWIGWGGPIMEKMKSFTPGPPLAPPGDNLRFPLTGNRIRPRSAYIFGAGPSTGAAGSSRR